MFWTSILAQVASSPAPGGNGIPIPVSLDWAPALLLTMLWILVAATVIGSVAHYFRLNAQTDPRG